MAYRKPRVPPQFADLISTLAQSKNVDNSLYQVVQEIINRLAQFTFEPDTIQIIGGGGGGGGGDASKFATYHTKNDETAALPNSVQLLAGTNIIFDDSVANKRTISSVGGAGGGAHAPTHEPGGSDPLVVDAVPSIGSLRTLGGGPNQAAPGNDPRFSLVSLHAPTHSEGGTDPVDVKNLAGYPGGTTQFLRADKTFAVPPAGSGGGSGGMEYKGDYVPGTYNDGDVVVWTDGISYVCTVNGTTTPPEPWPQGGLATSDAKYWTVDPHPALANERALVSLGAGYVKSNAGEPSVVATIPLTDTTGILPDNRLTSNVALKNINNNFVAQTLASNSEIRGPNSAFILYNTTANLNQKHWRFISYGAGNSNLYIEALNDAGSAVQAQFAFGGDNQLYGGGGGLTNLNASNLATGLVNTARLGSGTANSTTFLRGDNTWAVPPASDGVPTGALILMTTPCPAGYTRVAGWDGYYARFGPVHTSGGASQHQHGVGSYAAPAHTHPAGTLTVPSHGHSAGSLSVDSHNHGSVTVGFGISGTTGASGGHNHGFSGTTGGESAGKLSVDGGSSGDCTRGPHTHTFSGSTDSEANHSHSFSGSGSGSGATGNASPGVSGTTGAQAATTITGSSGSAGAAAITGLSDIQLNNPLFIDFYACLKN